MRVALVNHTLAPPGPGGAEVCVVALARYLRNAHEVTLLSGAATKIDGVECIQLPTLDLLPPDAIKLRKLVLHARDQWRWSVHRKLRYHLARAAVDVVHTHEIQRLSAAVFTAISSLGLAHVHTAHDPNLLCARILMDRRGKFCGGHCLACQPQRMIRGRTAAARLDALITPCAQLRDLHIAAGIVPSEKAVLIRQGVEPGERRIRDPEPDSVRLGFIGRLARHKGPLTLLRAMRQLPRGWGLTIAGGGPLESAVRAAARESERVEYVGWVDGSAKERFYSEVDLLVVPSEWEEPAPLVVAEAAIRGIPAVVSDRGGLPETPLCRVFRSGDSAGLASLLTAFVENGAVGETSAELLRREQEFLVSRYTKETELVLQEVASSRCR